MQFRFKLSFLPVAGLLLAGFCGPDASAQERGARSVPGELLVRWKSQRAPLVLAPRTDPARWQQSDLQAQLGAALPGSRLKKSFASSGWSLITLPAGQSTSAARAALAHSLGAANVSLNFRRYATRTPNDPNYGAQWQWPKIKAPDAWNTAIGGGTVVVGVLDSGIDLKHPDLQANLWRNGGESGNGKETNGIDDDGNGYIDDVYGLNAIVPRSAPQDEHGHGTHCAGLIGAVGNNGKGATGAIWNVKVMALRFLDADGSGADDDAITCLEYAIKMKQRGVNLRVISNSYAGPDDNPAFKEAYQAAEKAGILNVCAAGNEGRNNDTSPQYPASYSTGTNISVAASDQNDARAYFSNVGARGVDIAAPGVAIPSLRLGGGVINESGTSMATPIVAGAAAIVSSREPGLSPSAIKARLMTTVDKIAAWQGLVVSGGRLNMARAIGSKVYQLKGQVYRLDGTSHVGLAGAVVSLSGKATGTITTNASGVYSFSNLVPGTYTLKVALSGFTFESPTRTFPLASGATVLTCDIRALSAPTTYTFFGVARDAAGVPKAGISILSSTTSTTVLAVTDSLGKYSLANRAAGTYSLRASGGGYAWSTLPATITVPEKALNGRAEVNFKGVIPDKSAPAVTISAPAEGAVLAPGAPVASGIARDATGVQTVYLQLTRFINFVPSYYDWTARFWVSQRTPATVLARTATGKETQWAATLPSLTAASYSLRVWGRDTLGNVSTGEADAFSSFDVVANKSSQRTGAATSAGES